jgi:hypothetical protein
LGWQRAGTLNLHIRYGQMSLALVAQAALHQLRQRLGEPFCRWEATHFARHLFGGLEGDVRVKGDTILGTRMSNHTVDECPEGMVTAYFGSVWCPWIGTGVFVMD